MKRYADLIGNYKNYRIKSLWDNKVDYRGEVIVALYNDSNIDKVIQYGDRVAQLVILPYQDVDFIEVKELEQTERGDGGFGSTGGS